MNKTLAASSAAAFLAAGLFAGGPAVADTPNPAAATAAVASARIDGFRDVDARQTYYTPITWMASEGLTTGYADRTFKPGRHITRAETAAFLYRYLDPDFTAPQISPFPDVSTGSVHYPAVSWMHAEGMAGGYTDGSFRPTRGITRGEAAILLYGMDEHEKPHDFRPFKDVGFGHAAYEAIRWLRVEDLAHGYDRGRLFRPNQQITRGELSALLYRYDQEFGK
jgi:hypothetical protein